jgi:hypothetical protein
VARQCPARAGRSAGPQEVLESGVVRASCFDRKTQLVSPELSGSLFDGNHDLLSRVGARPSNQ